MDASIDVYVPTVDRFGIVRGSGIVGTVVDDQDDGGARLLVDYEGNVYGAQNVVTYADKVMQAWGRHSVLYPTVARLSLPLDALTKVGSFLPSAGRVYVDGPRERELLGEWLVLPEVPESELEVTRR